MKLVTADVALQIAREYLGKVSRLTIYVWASRGKFVSHKVGSCRFIDENSLRIFLSEKSKTRNQQACKQG